MIIRIKNETIDAVSVSVDNDTLTIQTQDEITPSVIIPLIYDSAVIEQLDELGNVIQKYEGKFSSVITEQTNEYLYIYIQLPAVSEIDMLKQQMTDLQLALCEIYESMEV